MIRPASVADAPVICSIYNHYLLNTWFTFEEEAVGEGEMSGRIQEVTATFPWVVLQDRDEVVGYACANRWKSRCAYRYSAESTVYLRPDCIGRGFGRQLYESLIAKLRDAGMHSVIGGIALPNDGSQHLHEKIGFRKVAHFEQVGWKFNRWIDVGYWELILSEESPKPAPESRGRLINGACGQVRYLGSRAGSAERDHREREQQR